MKLTKSLTMPMVELAQIEVNRLAGYVDIELFNAPSECGKFIEKGCQKDLRQFRRKWGVNSQKFMNIFQRRYGINSHRLLERLVAQISWRHPLLNI